jgi:hypothetical protein
LKSGKLILLSLFLILLVGACSGGQTSTMVFTLPAPQVQLTDLPTESTRNTVDPIPNNIATTPTAVSTLPSALEEIEIPEKRTHYELNLTLNYYTHYGIVEEIITYTNRSAQVFEELLLSIPPKNYPGSFTLRSLSDADGNSITNWREEGINLYVPLAQPLQPNQTTSLRLNFRLDFPTVEGTFGISGRQTNLMNWYPYIPPYDETEGWITHPQQVVNNMVVGEYVVNEVADFDVTLKLTDREELIEVAASAPAVEANGLRSYHLELARSFAFSISDSYFEHEIVQDGVRIHSYVFMEAQDAGKAVTEIAAQALKLFGELYYPYPREMLSIVAADFLHNMEMDGMVMINHGMLDFYDDTPKNNLTIMTPHEVSHQWFYSLVGNDQAMEPWLDEALATYHEVLFYQRYYPELVQWWWDKRVNFYIPQGAVNSDIYIAGGYESYRNAVYLRGAMFLQEIRDAVGDEAFFAALKDYAISNTYKIATSEDFFDSLAKYSAVDLSPILARYFSD